MLYIVTMSAKKPKTVKTEEEKIRTFTQNKDLKETFLAKKFRNSRSYRTVKTYDHSLNKFEEFIRVEHNLDYEQLIRAISTKKLQALDVLDDFYTFLTQYKMKNGKVGFANGTTRTYIIVAKEFLNSSGVKLYNEEVRQRFRLPKRQQAHEEQLTKNIINRVIRSAGLKLATVVLIVCSSGMRIGEINQLKLSDINFDTTPTTILIRKETTKTREARYTHISTETTNSLKDYLAKTFGWKVGMKSDKFVFMQTHEEKIAKYKEQIKSLSSFSPS